MKTQTEALNQAKQKIESAMKCHPNAVLHLLGEAWDFINEALAQPEQEPVAWMVYTLDGTSVCVTDNPADFTPEHRALPLYTTPPQRKPLTDEQRRAIIQMVATVGQAIDMVEAAHGIKGDA